jgi:hypothetical protein
MGVAYVKSASPKSATAKSLNQAFWNLSEILCTSQAISAVMHITFSILFLNTLFISLSCPTLALVIYIRQDAWSNYSSCAQGCYQTDVTVAECPWTPVEALNTCVCNNDTLLTKFMACTYQDCGDEGLEIAANTTVDNCDGTNTPSVLAADQLVGAGMGNSSPSSTLGTVPLSSRWISIQGCHIHVIEKL